MYPMAIPQALSSWCHQVSDSASLGQLKAPLRVMIERELEGTPPCAGGKPPEARPRYSSTVMISHQSEPDLSSWQMHVFAYITCLGHGVASALLTQEANPPSLTFRVAAPARPATEPFPPGPPAEPTEVRNGSRKRLETARVAWAHQS
jgi:hypothetical protein